MSHRKSGLKGYNEAFSKEVLRQLNKGQKAAVDRIEGPVMVIAGPGTGKTHILAARVGNILLKTDVNARNILCLTFTEAAVLAMRKRLLSFIGPEAYRVHIYTFHSFCNRVIQDNLELFGKQELEPLNDLERISLIRGLIDRLPYRHPLRQGRANPYFYERHLRTLFRWMKLERWDATMIRARSKDYLVSLPERKEFIYQVNRGSIRKGTVKRAKVEIVRLKMHRLEAAADLFEAYNDALRQARRYDYEDMILWVIRAFEQHQYLLRSYQEQYQYFLVDEFQDTNGAQNEVIRNLVAYWPNPNLFIVGDDDQSIFEFQGARLKNLVDFYRKYQEDIGLFVLEENYRSSQLILDGAEALIGQNEKRIVHSLEGVDVRKVLRAKNPDYADLVFWPEVVSYKNRFQEEVGVLEAIRGLKEEGYPLDEIAIIYARHRQARNIILLLEKHGIPYQTQRKINLLDIPLMIQFRKMLEYLVVESEQPGRADHLLYRMLHFRFLKIVRRDVEKLSWHLARESERERGAWKRAIADANLHQQLGLKSGGELRSLSEFLEEAVQRSFQDSLAYLMEWLINRSGILRYAIAQAERVWLVQVLKSLMDFVKTENYKKPRLTLKGLLDLFAQLDDNFLSIEVINEIKAHQGVNLLTAHGAKGLEFGRVFIIDAVKENWEPASRAGAFQFTLPDTLTYSGEEDAMEARRRLFYVAMTRARENVRVSYGEENGAGKPLERAVFVNEILAAGKAVVRPAKLSESAILETQILELSKQEKPLIRTLEDKWIDDLLAGFRLSASALAQYLSCPLGFYYEYILRIPYLPSEAAIYGTAVHGALYHYFVRMLSDKEKSFPGPGGLVEYFEREMELRRTDLSYQNYLRYLEQGRHHLPALYDRKAGRWNRDVKVEMTIREVEVEGVPLTGTIDKIEFIDGQLASIVDYKTGGHDKSKLSRPTKARPHGGNYWRQLVFYKILFEAYDISDRVVKEGKIVYIDPDPSGNFKEAGLELERTDVKAVKRLIVESYDKIRRGDFREGCDLPTCNWCNFVKNNDLITSFANGLVEELDDD